MLVKKNTLLSAAIALALAACGGGSSTTSAGGGTTGGGTTGGGTVITAQSNGTAVDGYLEGSTVTCQDGSGTPPITTTKADGTYVFATACSAPITVSGGLNNVAPGVQYVFKSELKSPAGSSVVTPLTTLIPATAEGLAALKKSLGMEGSAIDLTKTDPADGSNFGLLKTTQAMQTLMQSMADTFGGSYATIAASLSNNMADPLAAPLFLAGGAIDTSILMKLVSAAALAATGSPIDPSLLASMVSDLQEQAQKFSQATSLDALTNIAVQLQNPNAPKIDLTANTKFLALQNDSISFNKTKTKPGTPIALADFAAGAATISGLRTIDLEFDVSRMPTIDAQVGMFLELVEQGGQGRTLQIMIDKVNTKLIDGQLSIDANGAKVYVYGLTSNGSEISLTLNDLTFNPVSGDVSSKNTANFNFDDIVNRVLNSSNNTTSTTAAKFTGITGTFATKIIVSNLNIRHEDSSKFNLTSATVTKSGQTITGRTITGLLNIQ